MASTNAAQNDDLHSAGQCELVNTRSLAIRCNQGSGPEAAKGVGAGMVLEPVLAAGGVVVVVAGTAGRANGWVELA